MGKKQSKIFFCVKKKNPSTNGTFLTPLRWCLQCAWHLPIVDGEYTPKSLGKLFILILFLLNHCKLDYLKKNWNFYIKNEGNEVI